ncbi:hypothetical protein COOONC_18388 [Cooperia oncophora]
MTSGQHNIRVEGGTPHLVIESGRACVEVKTNHGLPQITEILPPFVTPVDIFANLGPLQALLYTTQAPLPAEPSFPRPDELAALELGFNDTRCVTCLNGTSRFSTTRLPPNVVPTFPAQSVTYAPFPTLVSLITGETSFPEITDGTTVPAVPSIGSTPPQQTQTSTLTSRITTVTITTARVTTHPSETAVSSSTSDQFVIGQFDGVSSQGPQTTGESEFV